MIQTETHDAIRHIIINAPEKRNAFTIEMLQNLSRAFTEADDDNNIRAILVYAKGKHFTLGLNLPEVSAWMQKNRTFPIDDTLINPFATTGRIRKTPLIVAAHGFTFTLGIELMLASDIRICAEKTIFSQLEVGRGIIPFGGATIRFPSVAGWGNAMKYILTGEQFDAGEAYRIGLVQEVVPKDRLIERGVELAQKVAANAPLAVSEAIVASRIAEQKSFEESVSYLMPKVLQLMETEDAKEGVNSFIEKRAPVYKGR